MAEPSPMCANTPYKHARPESRYAINFINFPLDGNGGGVTFAPCATRPRLTPAALRSIGAE